MKLFEMAPPEYYIVEVEWSQTDKDTYIVKAASKEEAEKKTREKLDRSSGALYITAQKTPARML